METAGAGILIVEDEAVVAMDLEQRLTRIGHRVLATTGTAEGAARCAGDLHPDLALMDIRLKGTGDGIEAADEIRRRFDIPVVFVTAYSDAQTVQRAKAAGPYGYVLKPVDDRELDVTIALAIYRHRAERRLRAMERWLSTALRSIADGVIATDLAGRITFFSPVAQMLTGWQEDEALARHVDDVLVLVNEETGESIENPVHRVLSEGLVVGLSPATSLLRRDGTRIAVSDSAAPMRDASDTVSGMVIVIRDVREQRKRDEEQRQAQKLEAVGRLAGGIAHEFNNLMTVVVGQCDLLLEDAALAPALHAPVEDIRGAGRRAASLTRQLLTFGRKQPFRPEALDLNGIVNGIAQMLARILGDHVRLVTELSPDPVVIRADKAQIEQMIVNLAANGRDAMPAGGTLTIATFRDGPFIALRVTDTGVGITPEVRLRLFEPFFTTKGVGQGTGLGLAAVHGTVAAAGGRIDVESAPGAGTSFIVRFPAHHEEPEAPLVPAHAALSWTDVRDKTVLVVDDEKAVREIIARVLRRVGFTVIEAEDGRAALDAVREHLEPLFLVITDAVMPEGGGIDLLRQIARERPGTHLLLMSGYAERTVLPGELGDLHASFLQKPFAPSELLQRVHQLLSG